jgi:hypothetical protein
MQLKKQKRIGFDSQLNLLRVRARRDRRVIASVTGDAAISVGAWQQSKPGETPIAAIVRV